MKHGKLSLFGSVVFLTLFPGYFYYHSAVAAGVISPVLGGFFGPMSVYLGVPMVVFGFGTLARGREPILFIDRAFVLYVIFIMVWITLHYVLGSGEQKSADFYSYNVSTVFMWMAVYMAVRNLDLNRKWIRWALSISLLLFLAIAAWSSNGQFYDTAQIAGDAVRVSGYQGLARSAVVVALAAMAFHRGLRAVLVILITVPLLFLLGARSEFVAFLVVAAALFALRDGVSPTTLIWVPLGVAGLVYLAVSFHIFEGGSRILQLLEIRESSSYQARQELQQFAVRAIVEHPVLGSYASQLELGEMGDYAHNALSAWVSFGLAGFLGFVFLLGYALVQSVRLARKGYAAEPEVALALAFSIYTVTLAATAKSVNDPIFALAWGAIACALRKRRRAATRPVLVPYAGQEAARS
ncbi:O-antigen ligase [Cupriavidus pauculus]|uniref:O-antigen ligase family protein n=1 Tax=Cupriavidus pauculus TaxID=82633 RepID=UPI001EE2C859|nr:hypothetical protein [Cupriavidus pauculus]GJG94625.1 O-antigen ligase family protein [Cupriavidus pauculus]